MNTSPAPTVDPAAHHPAGDAPRSVGSRVALTLVRVYQGFGSGRVSPCRFTPSCSNYAVEAIERHGARRGVPLVLRRLARCRPGGPFGSDPVPDCDPVPRLRER